MTYVLTVSELRLGVGRPNGLHGLTWRLWSNNDSLYVLAREMQGSWKVGLHPPNKKGTTLAFWYGFQKAWLDQNPDGMEPPDHRRLEQYWPRERGPGVRRMATIRTHADALAGAPIANPGGSVIYWCDPPEDGKSLDLHLLIVAPTEEAAAWVRANVPADALYAGITEESVLGDLLVVGAYRRTPKPGVRLVTDAPDGSLTVVASAIQREDGSLMLEQMRATPLGE
jgi:hypothetical protein